MPSKLRGELAATARALLCDELAGLRSLRVGRFRIIYRVSPRRVIELVGTVAGAERGDDGHRGREDGRSHRGDPRRRARRRATVNFVTLVSFDIDGTLEVGEPPAIVPAALVRTANRPGNPAGSGSDGPTTYQQDRWSRPPIP